MTIDAWKPVAPEEPYTVLAIWQGTTVDERDDVERFFVDACGTRIKRVGCVQCHGGRCDFAFFVHRDDVVTFATRRFQAMPGHAPRWWEDICFNEQQHQFPPEFRTYCQTIIEN